MPSPHHSGLALSDAEAACGVSATAAAEGCSEGSAVAAVAFSLRPVLGVAADVDGQVERQFAAGVHRGTVLNRGGEVVAAGYAIASMPGPFELRLL